MKTVTPRGKFKARPTAARPRTRGKALEIRSVLVPIDFSKPSLQAIQFARPLLQEFGAKLHLAHVIDSVFQPSSLAALPLTTSRANARARVRSRLKEVAHKYGIELRSENIHALRGSPFEEICRLAQDEGVDLIVTATRGNTGLKHLVLGSTAERVIRYSPCPVLVVRGADWKIAKGHDAATSRAMPIGKILVPVDFSDCSSQGLAYARALARRFDATLVLINAVHVHYYVTSDEYARYDLPLLMEEAEKASRKQMRDLVQKTDWEGLKVEAFLPLGHPGDQICAQAKRQRADLIVTSTHGTTGLGHVLLGSTAEYVVRHASTPVLVVPSRKRRPERITAGK